MSGDRLHLIRLRLERFGAFSGRSIGRFGPGLNVVHGANEAGKSTTASLVSQVLFGWDRKTAGTAHYGVDGSSRKGSLTFVGPHGEWELVRTEGSTAPTSVQMHGGRPWDGAFEELVVGLDKETYGGVFSFDSEQLRSLSSGGDVAARLVTAESSTSVSPIDARQAIVERMQTYTGSGKSAVNSIPNVRARIDELRIERAELRANAAGHARLEHEIARLTASIERADEAIGELMVEESRAQSRAAKVQKSIETLESLDGQIAIVCTRLEQLDRSIDALAQDAPAAACAEQVNALAALRQADERLLVDVSEAEAAVREAESFLAGMPDAGIGFSDDVAPSLMGYRDRLSAARIRLDSASAAVEAASADVVATQAELDRLDQAGPSAGAGTRPFDPVAVGAFALAAASIVVAVLAVFAGQYPVAIAAVLAGAAVTVAALMRGRTDAQTIVADGRGALEVRLTERRIALERETALRETARSASDGLVAEFTRYLSAIGLDTTADVDRAIAIVEAQRRREEAHAALEARRRVLTDRQERLGARLAAVRSALSTLGADDFGDSAASVLEALDRAALRCRAAAAAADERRRLEQDRARAAVDHDALVAQRDSVVSELAGSMDVPVGEVDASSVRAAHARMEHEIALLGRRRADKVDERGVHIGERGKLIGVLETVRGDRTQDEVEASLAVQEAMRERLVEEYAVLLAAKRLLDEAVSRWEEERQPEVYRIASAYFESFTGGRWVEVRPGDKDGEFLAVDMDRVVRKPGELSTATVQQLYLALRLALLDANPGVGVHLPVVMDDPFVHFDPERRRNAVATVADLARRRQVLYFTQDPATVEEFALVSPEATSVDL